MKKIITLLGVVACVAGVSSLQAAPQSATSSTTAKRRYSTIYITSVSSLGSHIPLVVRAYDGSIVPMSGVYVYGKTDIVNTGPNLNVASALYERDPAITPTPRPPLTAGSSGKAAKWSPLEPLLDGGLLYALAASTGVVPVAS